MTTITPWLTSVHWGCRLKQEFCFSKALVRTLSCLVGHIGEWKRRMAGLGCSSPIFSLALPIMGQTHHRSRSILNLQKLWTR